MTTKPPSRSPDSKSCGDHHVPKGVLLGVPTGTILALLGHGPRSEHRARLGAACSTLWRRYHPNFVHCPSETTSTEPSTTLMAVCSSMA